MANTYPPPPSSAPRAAQNSTLALISLVSGILGLTVVPLIGSLVAVITGPMAKREIRESGGALGGEGLATAGMIMGWIGIGLAALGLCAVVFAFGFSACMLFFGLSREWSSLLLPVLLDLL